MEDLQLFWSRSLAPEELLTAGLGIVGLLLGAVVGVLALHRLALSWQDHRLTATHSASFDFVHPKLRSQIATVDRWGKSLTVGLVTYAAVLLGFLAYRVVDETIRRLMQLLRLL
jgi:hypothetical protein